jgi:hypothetical protein
LKKEGSSSAVLDIEAEFLVHLPRNASTTSICRNILLDVPLESY